MYSNNDWRSFQHSWGTKPEQKKREREYNHQYWIDHKEEIMKKRRAKKGGSSEDYEKNRAALEEARKNRGDEDYSREAAKSVEDLYKMVDGDVDLLEKLIKMNEKTGGYADAVMDNIRQHNQNIIDNITALSDAAEKHIKSNNLSGDAAKAYLENISKQINKALDQALDLRDDSTHDYLGGKKKKSGGGSSSSSKSSKKSGDDSKSKAGEAAKKVIEKATKSSSGKKKDEDEDEYYQRANAIYKKVYGKNKPVAHSEDFDLDEFLEHHGILGMKWGVQLGPPYPLTGAAAAAAKARKAAGKVAGKIKEGYTANKVKRAEKAQVRAQKQAAEKQERFEKAKQKVIRSGDPELVRKFQNKLTTQEFTEAVTRCNLNKSLTPSSASTLKTLSEKVKTRTDYINTGIKAWNTAATIYNTFHKDPLPVINGKYQEKKEKPKDTTNDPNSKWQQSNYKWESSDNKKGNWNSSDYKWTSNDSKPLLMIEDKRMRHSAILYGNNDWRDYI